MENHSWLTSDWHRHTRYVKLLLPQYFWIIFCRGQKGNNIADILCTLNSFQSPEIPCLFWIYYKCIPETNLVINDRVVTKCMVDSKLIHSFFCQFLEVYFRKQWKILFNLQISVWAFHSFLPQPGIFFRTVTCLMVYTPCESSHISDFTLCFHIISCGMSQTEIQSSLLTLKQTELTQVHMSTSLWGHISQLYCKLILLFSEQPVILLT